MRTLYVVGTPIGNLGDMTYRAVEILRGVGVIAAEDTRTTRKLLQHYEIHTPLISFFEHNAAARIEPLLDRLTRDDVALVSDAGMPGISDPGYELVTAAVALGVPIVPVPGPSAPITALAVSGLPTDAFTYLGFLPRRSGERRRALAAVASEQRTLVLLEAPHRVVAMLQDAQAVLGDRPAVLAREITKVYEEFLRGRISTLLEQLAARPPRGEFTIVLAGASAPVAPEENVVRSRLAALLTAGETSRAAIEKVAQETSLPRRKVYRLLLAGFDHDRI